MARPYRLQAENTFYHIMSRGDDRKAIFRRSGDYQKFLFYCQEVCERFRCQLYAYVLMPNHYHLLLETPQPNLSRIMQYLNTAYTVYYNVKHQRTGHLFQGRYKSIVVEKEKYLLALTRYIHLNPVKSGIVSCAADYRWSSYRYYSQGDSDRVIDGTAILGVLGMTTNEYVQFVTQAMEREDQLPSLQAGMIMGSEEFVERMVGKIRKSSPLREVAFGKKFGEYENPETVIKAIEVACGKKREKIFSGHGRTQNEKQIVVYLLRRHTPLTNAQIGEIVGMNWSAVSKAAHGFERRLGQDKRLRREMEKIVSKFEFRGLTVCHEVAQKMREGLSVSAGTSRYQTTLSCCVQKTWW
ncbi:MAG: transposase [Candidatus Omnitrophica bacterium]|nr:transposase [Candidatus Omnitrophota bacterium]